MSAPLGPGLLLKHALDQAAVWHAAQKRKYPGVKVPYVSHLAGVVAILARHGLDEEVQAAGALHDCAEDARVSYPEIERQFGARVAELVRDVSEPDKSLSWEERKAAYLAHFRTKSWHAQAISLADKIDNLRSIVVCARLHGDPWAMFKRGREPQLARFEAMRSAAREITQAQMKALVREYEEALDAVREV